MENFNSDSGFDSREYPQRIMLPSHMYETGLSVSPIERM